MLSDAQRRIWADSQYGKAGLFAAPINLREAGQEEVEPIDRPLGATGRLRVRHPGKSSGKRLTVWPGDGPDGSPRVVRNGISKRDPMLEGYFA